MVGEVILLGGTILSMGRVRVSGPVPRWSFLKEKKKKKTDKKQKLVDPTRGRFQPCEHFTAGDEPN